MPTKDLNRRLSQIEKGNRQLHVVFWKSPGQTKEEAIAAAFPSGNVPPESELIILHTIYEDPPEWAKRLGRA